MSVVWSVCVYRSCYVSDGLNLWCVSGAILWVSCLCFNFSAEFSCFTCRPILISWAFLHLCFSGTQCLRIAWSKGSNRIDASCLKTDAEPASETGCFSIYIYIYIYIYICYTMDKVQEKKIVSVSNLVIYPLSSVVVLWPDE